jgi:hypothetical protein
MQIVKREELLEKIKGFDESIMSYTFFAGFESYVKACAEGDMWFAVSGNNMMAVRKYSLKKFGFAQIMYPPQTINGKRLSEADEKLFFEDFVVHVRSKKFAIRIIAPYLDLVSKTFPDASVHCEFANCILTMHGKTDEQVFAEMHSKRRNNIRAGERAGVTIKWGKETLPDFHALYSITMKRSNLYVEPLEKLSMWQNYLGDNLLCGVAYMDNIPQGSIYVPYSKFEAYYVYGGSAENVIHHGALPYLQWEAIKLLKSKDIKQYNFGSARMGEIADSKLASIQKFKEQFGAKPIPGYLWKMDVDKLSCKVFDTLLKARYALSGMKKYKDKIDKELAAKAV